MVSPTDKGLEHIQNDVNNLIREISDDKNKTEIQLKNIAVELDDKLKFIKQQEFTITSQLNSTGQSLQNKYNKSLEEASIVLGKSIDLFSNDAHDFKITYRRSLLILLVSLFILVLFSETLISSISWISINSNRIPEISILILFTVFILFAKAYFKLNSKINSDLKTLNEAKTYFNNSKIVCNIPPVSTGNIRKTEISIEHVKNVLGSLLFNVGKTVPVINQAYDEINLLSKYRKLIESFESAMSYYRLLEDHEYFDNLSKIAPLSAHTSNYEEEWKNIITKKVSQRLYENDLKVSENLILLMYNEHQDLETRKLFRVIFDQEAELENLASILINSQRLVVPVSEINYNQKDIVALLKKLDEFNLSEINNLLNKASRLLDYLTSYVEFLNKNGICSSYKPTIEFIVTESDSIENPFEKHIIDLVYKAGTEIFSEIEDLDPVLIDGFTRASISLKFHDDISLREIACKCSGKNASTAIIRAYYEKYNEIDRQKIVSLEELIDNLELITYYLENIDDNELQFLKTQLKEGKWYDSSVAYIIDFINKSNASIKDEIAKIGDFKILKESVTEVFHKVKIGTIEKAIDSQIFSAYIIMSDSSEGNLTDIIDELSIRNSRATNEEKKWQKKNPNHRNRIESTYGINLKYDFVQFSNSTRIGILPKGESFFKFQQEFLEDIKKMLNHKNEKFKIGLVIQRITPSKYSFGILDDDELSTNITMKNLDVARYIARLAVDYVSFEEKVSVMKFEKDIDLLEIVNHKSIHEIIRKDESELDNKEIRILESSELRNNLLQEINEKLGINDFKSLAMSLHSNYIGKSDLNKIVSDVLSSHLASEPRLRKNARIRAIRLSERFSDALEKLAYIYELQKN